MTDANFMTIFASVLCLASSKYDELIVKMPKYLLGRTTLGDYYYSRLGDCDVCIETLPIS